VLENISNWWGKVYNSVEKYWNEWVAETKYAGVYLNYGNQTGKGRASGIKKIVNEAAAKLNCRIFLFGSRSIGTSHRTSDYDLGIKGLDSQNFRKLKRSILDCHEDSRIFVGIDIINFDTADDEFLSIAMKGANEWPMWVMRTTA